MLYDKNPNSIPISSSAQNKPSVFDLLQTFLKDNPQIGYLTFQVFQDSPLQGRLPVANAKVTVSKLLGDDYYISKVIMTDGDGKIENIPLPTVSRELSQVSENAKPFSTYNVSVEAPNFLTLEVFDIPVFEGITSIQSINLKPNI